ncbi:hypothetical protein [Sorangium sp. So ce693]|uniref:hypothetical protein n=1 Tax=Sorangium sp. So ce693 TaxID=3133318 RepID=UPI003F5F66AF
MTFRWVKWRALAGCVPVLLVGACSSGSPDDEELRGTARLAASAEDATCMTIQRGTAGAVEDATIWETYPT